MTTDLFIRTWRNDFEWLKYCLKSSKKHLRGFRNIHLAMSDADADLLGPVDGCIIHRTGRDWGDGYIQQMNDKLHADLYTDADFICHTDSDCVWTRDLRPEDLMENGKPVYLMHPFGGEYNPWPPIVEKILGWRSPFSFMLRHPFLYPRGVYQEYRNFVEIRHGNTPLAHYIEAQPYREFIEYESMGAWAHRYAHDAFTWKDQADFPVFVRQEWSWGGLNDRLRLELDSLTA
jgi:hypothetical protein